MDLRIPYDFAYPRTATGAARPQLGQDSRQAAQPPPSNAPPSDPVAIVMPANGNLRPALQTRLISEQREDLETGYRLIRTFEQPDGRSFTRAEEITLTGNGARRGVVQQNPSGAITRYEEILDREDGGTFRRTQRFQDEAGEIATQISTDYKVNDPFILTGTGSSTYPYDTSPFSPMRGTQLDLRA